MTCLAVSLLGIDSSGCSDARTGAGHFTSHLEQILEVELRCERTNETENSVSEHLSFFLSEIHSVFAEEGAKDTSCDAYNFAL